MKLIKTEQCEKFKPFQITLELETEEEARLLWHIANRVNIRAKIFSDDYGREGEYLRAMNNSFGNAMLREEIAEHVTIYKD